MSAEHDSLVDVVSPRPTPCWGATFSVNESLCVGGRGGVVGRKRVCSVYVVVYVWHVCVSRYAIAAGAFCDET